LGLHPGEGHGQRIHPEFPFKRHFAFSAGHEGQVKSAAASAIKRVEDVEAVVCVRPVVQGRGEHPVEHQQLVFVQVDFWEPAVHRCSGQVSARTKVSAYLGSEHVGSLAFGLRLPFFFGNDLSKHHRQRTPVVVVVHVIKHETKGAPVPSVGLVLIDVIEVNFDAAVDALPTRSQGGGVVVGFGFNDALHERLRRIFFFPVGTNFCCAEVERFGLEADVDLLGNPPDHSE